MTDLIATVGGIYESFGKGDVPAILDILADDVQWESWSDWTPHREGTPWLAARTGKAGAGEFFGIIGGWKIKDFQVRSLLAGANQAAAEIVIEVELPSGATFRDEELHLWTFNDAGRVTRFRHYVDTAKHIAAGKAG